MKKKNIFKIHNMFINFLGNSQEFKDTFFHVGKFLVFFLQ